MEERFNKLLEEMEEVDEYTDKIFKVLKEMSLIGLEKFGKEFLEKEEYEEAKTILENLKKGEGISPEKKKKINDVMVKINFYCGQNKDGVLH